MIFPHRTWLFSRIFTFLSYSTIHLCQLVTLEFSETPAYLPPISSLHQLHGFYSPYVSDPPIPLFSSSSLSKLLSYFPRHFQCLLIILLKFTFSYLTTHSLYSSKCNINSSWVISFLNLKHFIALRIKCTLYHLPTQGLTWYDSTFPISSPDLFSTNLNHSLFHSLCNHIGVYLINILLSASSAAPCREGIVHFHHGAWPIDTVFLCWRNGWMNVFVTFGLQLRYF